MSKNKRDLIREAYVAFDFRNVSYRGKTRLKYIILIPEVFSTLGVRVPYRCAHNSSTAWTLFSHLQMSLLRVETHFSNNLHTVVETIILYRQIIINGHKYEDASILNSAILSMKLLLL